MHDGGRWSHPLNISTIILQSSSSNLESAIKSLTILDNLLTNNVDDDNIIPDHHKTFKILKGLFSSCSLKEKYIGNQYVLNIFNAFINNKHKIDINIYVLDKWCKNKGLLGLILSDIKEGEEYSDEYKDKNLLKPQILSIFKNVTHLNITCSEYPLSLESLLSLIKDTNIEEVTLSGYYWLRKVKELPSFNSISRKYEEANFSMEFKRKDKELLVRFIK